MLFVDGIMEGVEYFYEGNEIVAVSAEKYKEQMDKMTTKASCRTTNKIIH